MKKSKTSAKNNEVRDEDVIWCYRTLLGREPESAGAIGAHLNARDFKDLVTEFVQSDEFLSRLSRQPRAVRSNLLNMRPMHIDLYTNDVQLSSCNDIIKQAWSRLGAIKPHYSVLTHEQYLPDNLEHSIEGFWNSGEREADAVVHTLKRFGIDNLGSLDCAEYGCGVGRVTMGLARNFANVSAFDISENHIVHARARARELDRSNIHWTLVDNVLELSLGSFDLFYSQIVFQHNPPPIIQRLVSWALSSLKPGGIALFQVPTYSEGYSFDLAAWLSKREHSDIQMHIFPQEEVFRLAREHDCHVLEVREDNRTGDTNRYVSNTFAIRRSAP